MRKLILTFAIGDDFTQLARLTHPYWQHYAARVGADFLSITEAVEHPEDPRLEKCRAIQLAAGYNRVLLADTDMVVRPDTPDLFALVPRGHVGALDEGRLHTPELLAGTREDVANTARAFGRPVPTYAPDDVTYVNTGLVLLDTTDLWLFQPYTPRVAPGGLGLADQSIFNLRMRERPVRLFFLPICFNAMLAHERPGWQECEFIPHWSGWGTDGRPRLPAVRALLEEWQLRFPGVVCLPS